MYFQSLENLKKRYSELPRNRKISYKKAVDDLDFWLMTLSSAKKRRLNPNEFSDVYGYDREIGLEIFYDLGCSGALKPFFEIRSNDGSEVLFRSENLGELTRGEPLYSEMKDEYVDWNDEQIELYYRLIDRPKGKLMKEDINLKKVESPSCSMENSNNEEVTKRLEQIICANRRETT